MFSKDLPSQHCEVKHKFRNNNMFRHRNVLDKPQPFGNNGEAAFLTPPSVGRGELQRCLSLGRVLISGLDAPHLAGTKH